MKPPLAGLRSVPRILTQGRRRCGGSPAVGRRGLADTHRFLGECIVVGPTTQTSDVLTERAAPGFGSRMKNTKPRGSAHWFSLARQPQEPLSPEGRTLTGEELARWRDEFSPLLDFLKKREVVLSLSGGGLALACHISVLRVLELLSLEVDKIYGTSAGAIIGGLWAAGMSATHIEEAILGIESPDELFGRGARHVTLRMIAGEVRSKVFGAALDHSGIYPYHRVEGYVDKVLTEYVGRIPKLGELDVNMSCVAFDIGSGGADTDGAKFASKQLFSPAATPDVSLSDAIAASMAIPGVFPPKRVGDRYYIDGGVVENLPIVSPIEQWSAKRSMFGKKLAIIAVDLGYGGETLTEERLSHTTDLRLYADSLQSRTISQYNLLSSHKPSEGRTVVLVRPKVFNISIWDIEKIPDAIHTAYVETVRQLSGHGFLDETEEDIERARRFLGIRGPLRGNRSLWALFRR